MGDNNVNLPPGFRFYPTDEELVVHFLHRKATLLPCHPDVIPDLDLYPYDPWELDGKALAEGNKWYFYSRKTQNRATSNGYWKAMGMEDPVNNSAGKKVGMKKYLVFYVGEAPSGIKTNWTMQEYRLSDSAASTSTSTRSSKRSGHSKIDYSNWVICRVYERDDQDHDDGTELSCLDEVFLSLDDLDEISLPN
ncbi:NAC domain-containing protein 104 isoform X2 [Juglans microcarpa x Juglans regia]|uniref:NAC domain-containing protein 104 isoform X1 n=1 Tax=Juglans microcarpa x Juglans regia TaxID=2249226 RepID=UPI001B7F3F4A|nr:NAC domain-containing protein 104 isoform X1 [Juglans microcarpa x Juglans regia]XP_041011798.1 NAC domain-containing protein 104 isoform X2 [Juglans microcarpa x Juglans regia]